MSQSIKRTLVLAAAVSLASLSAAAYTLAASDPPPRTSTVPCTTSTLQDPYQQAALRLMTRGMLDGRLLPNSQLTVRLDQPMTGGDAMQLLARALGKDELARSLSFRAPERTTEEEWLKGALLAANGQMVKWGAPARPGGGDAILQRSISVTESIALLMMALGVEPQRGVAWPDNILITATESGMIAKGDIPTGPAGEATTGSAFFLFDHTFYGYAIPNGKTVYTKHPSNAILSVNPYLSQTTEDKVMLSGAVSGSTQLVIKAGAVNFNFVGDGQWAVVLPLAMGANLIEIKGTDTNTGHYVQDPPVIITRVAK